MTDLEIMTTELNTLLKRCEELLVKKNHDYASDKNGFANFEKMAKIAGTSIETTFLLNIASKVARLAELLMDEKKPKNESVKDSIVDGINYFVLLASYLKKKESGKISGKDEFIDKLEKFRK